MKKIYFLLTLIATASFVNAQIKKSSILLGGQLSYSNASYEYTPTQPSQKSSGAYFNVNAGKAFKDNNVFGITAGYSHGNLENIYNGPGYRSSKTDSYNAGVFYRRYNSLGKDFYCFGAANAVYSGRTQNDTYTGDPVKYKTTDNGGPISFAPGIAYAVCKKLQIEVLLAEMISVGYSDQESKYPTNSSKFHSFYAGTSLSGSALNNLSIGFQLVL
jgi:hypothetical protein